jgi:hypothetical protein
MYFIMNYVPMNDDEATMMVMMCLEAEGFFQTKANMRGRDSEALKKLKENTVVWEVR